MAFTYETRGANGTVRTERIFKDIDEETDSYTHRSATGLLSATQFTQPALTLMEKAIFEDMRARGLVSEESSYAGHSLGEYSALTCMTEVLPIESLVSLVFYRGLTIQVAVEREEGGRSNFAMCAVDPSRVSKGMLDLYSPLYLIDITHTNAAIAFDEAALLFILRSISKESGWLLELVNFNVANTQYVCAGEVSLPGPLLPLSIWLHCSKYLIYDTLQRRAIHALTAVCNEIKARSLNFNPLLPSTTVTVLTAIRTSIAAASVLKEPVTLVRGSATIPLGGIDVPFHSSFLKPGVGSFRNCLHEYIDKETVDAGRLVGKYVPNLTAKPFEISKEYFEEVERITGSEVLKRVLSEV
jgi:fatty acid synthase subunit beta